MKAPRCVPRARMQVVTQSLAATCRSTVWWRSGKAAHNAGMYRTVSWRPGWARSAARSCRLVASTTARSTALLASTVGVVVASWLVASWAIMILPRRAAAGLPPGRGRRETGKGICLPAIEGKRVCLSWQAGAGDGVTERRLPDRLAAGHPPRRARQAGGGGLRGRRLHRPAPGALARLPLPRAGGRAGGRPGAAGGRDQAGDGLPRRLPRRPRLPGTLPGPDGRAGAAGAAHRARLGREPHGARRRGPSAGGVDEDARRGAHAPPAGGAPRPRRGPRRRLLRQHLRGERPPQHRRGHGERLTRPRRTADAH